MMIKELTWDTRFFKRKICELIIKDNSSQSIEASLKEAQNQDFAYLICRIDSHKIQTAKKLESAGLYLSDIAVTWQGDILDFIDNYKKRRRVFDRDIYRAKKQDIDMLQEMAKSFFIHSRFYHDPFFSHNEADRFFHEWIYNSVTGEAADSVFFIPNTGFITCKKSDEQTGKIVLIGVRKQMRGRGAGRMLFHKAIVWFNEQGNQWVSVKTQLRNREAMNFYSALDFSIKGYELTFTKNFSETRTLY